MSDLTLAQAEKLVLETATRLLKQDAHLFAEDANERSITHRFAVYLEVAFAGWHVDCEYNRDHHDPKRLDLPSRYDISSDDLDAKTVFPDIIIHRRGTDQNFVVIEVKKSTNPEKDDWDLTKLRAFKKQLGYRVAIFFRFYAGTQEGKFEYSILPDA